MGLLASSRLAKAGLGLLFLGMGLHLIGFATPEWGTSGINYRRSYYASLTEGLWMRCSLKGCNYRAVPAGFVIVTAVCESLALLTVLAGFLVQCVYTCSDSKKTKCMTITILVLSIIAGLWMLIGNIIWVASLENLYVGYSWTLSFIGGLCCIGAAPAPLWREDKCPPNLRHDQMRGLSEKTLYEVRELGETLFL